MKINPDICIKCKNLFFMGPKYNPDGTIAGFHRCWKSPSRVFSKVLKDGTSEWFTEELIPEDCDCSLEYLFQASDKTSADTNFSA